MRTLPFLLLLAPSLVAQRQPNPTPSPASTYLFCGAVFDSVAGRLLSQQLIEIKDAKIVAIKDLGSVVDQFMPGGTINLQHETCLPGLIDTHTHVLLQGDITAEDYDKQLLKESVAYRAIQATQSAVRALNNGFTTIRDLETEGAGYADVDLRNAINRGIVPGPRMKVAGRAMDVTGSYPLLGYAPEVPVPHGVQLVDGPDEVRKAVREQLSYGADWIKVYVDRSYYVRRDGVLDDVPTFTPDELRAAVDETHRQRHKIAAHAMALQGVHNARRGRSRFHRARQLHQRCRS
jgi:imidazolonepropionase-like amidohydrolase